ncbi:MAG: PqqD family protein [Janthinobacterium lividum]
MKLKPDVALSESGFLFNPATGDSFAANPVAAELLALARRGLDGPAARAEILARYDVAPAQLDKDWDDLLAQLRDFQLLA